MPLTQFNECDIEKIVKDRYKVSPVSIEKWNYRAGFNLQEFSNQNVQYLWRFDRPAEKNPAVVSASTNFPFFMGNVDLNVFNNDPVLVSSAEYVVLINGYYMSAINQNLNFYELTSEQWHAYKEGIGQDPTPAPAPLVNEYYTAEIAGNNIESPYMTIEVQTDATGSVALQVVASFKGFRIYLS